MNKGKLRRHRTQKLHHKTDAKHKLNCTQEK